MKHVTVHVIDNVTKSNMINFCVQKFFKNVQEDKDDDSESEEEEDSGELKEEDDDFNSSTLFKIDDSMDHELSTFGQV